MASKKQFDEEQFFDELEGEGDEENSNVKLDAIDIVRKYDEGQARILMQRNDFLIPNILEMVERKNILDISPPYQRRKRWTPKKRSHLIESLLMNIPIPPIFLYERDLAQYEVMDGQQRLDTIRAFFNNEFSLVNLKKWPELNNYRYGELPNRIQAGLNRRGLAAVIILTESGHTEKEALEIRQYVFERLNTGGEMLNPQEIRNCIYAGTFNDLIVELARSDLFTKAWGIPSKEPDEPRKVSRDLSNNTLYSSMADCQIVLRYFALSDLSRFRNGLKNTLDECMRTKQYTPLKECENLKVEYLSVLEIATRIYGESLFRVPDKTGKFKRQRSVPLYDAVLLAIRDLGRKSELLPDFSDVILQQTINLLMNKEGYEKLTSRGNTRREFEDRINLMKTIYSTVLE